MNLWASSGSTEAVDVEVFLDSANDVAYKMIGGAYGVLGAEVLGHFVPRILDSGRWGVYVREAGIAWLCSKLAPRLTRDPRLLNGLALRLARGVAQHHMTHHVVEEAFTDSWGRDQYVEILTKNAPRHPATEEKLADALLRAEIISGLVEPSQGLVDSALSELAELPPEGSAPRRLVAELLAELNRDLRLTMTSAEVNAAMHTLDVPHYLVLEPHLPGTTASAVREKLLTSR